MSYLAAKRGNKLLTLGSVELAGRDRAQALDALAALGRAAVGRI